MSSTIESIPADPTGIMYKLSVFGSNTKEFVSNVTTAGGRVIKSGAPIVGSFVQTVVEKSPIGTVATGLGLALTGAALAKREWSYRGNYNQCSNMRAVGYIALTITGLGISALGALHIYGFTFGSSTPVLVDLREAKDSLNEAAETIAKAPVIQTIVDVVDVNTANQTVIEVVANSNIAKALDNSTITVLTGYSAPVIEGSVDPILGDLSKVLNKAASAFDACTMSPLVENTSAAISNTICEPALEQFERVVPIKIPAPEVPGMFDGVTSTWTWLRKKVGG